AVDLLDRQFLLLLRPPDNEDVGPLVDEEFGRRRADPTAAAGDHRHLARELAHSFLPFGCRSSTSAATPSTAALRAPLTVPRGRRGTGGGVCRRPRSEKGMKSRSRGAPG